MHVKETQQDPCSGKRRHRDACTETSPRGGGQGMAAVLVLWVSCQLCPPSTWDLPASTGVKQLLQRNTRALGSVPPRHRPARSKVHCEVKSALRAGTP